MQGEIWPLNAGPEDRARPLQNERYRVLKLAYLVIVFIGLTWSYSVQSDDLEPVLSILPTSVKYLFFLHSELPKEHWATLDQEAFIGITGLSINDKKVAAAGSSLMDVPSKSCSIYDSTVCFSTGQFYQTRVPQILLSGVYKFNGNDALLFAFDSGFRSSKLNVEPGLLLGLSKRWFVTEERNSQIVMEASGWFKQSVTHTPCYDSFQREYECGNLSAWSDFSYDPHPSNFYFKIWFDHAF